MKLTTHPCVVPKFRMSGITPPLSCVPSWSAKGQLYLSFTFICLIKLWCCSVDVKIHKLSRDRCIYSWQETLSQRMYGLILWGLGYSFISQHCVKFWSYIATKQKWYVEGKGCHGEILFKLMPGKTIETHEIPVRITSGHSPVLKLGHHQIWWNDVKPHRFEQSEVLCCVNW